MESINKIVIIEGFNGGSFFRSSSIPLTIPAGVTAPTVVNSPYGTLTASNGSWDGGGISSYTYQWQISANNSTWSSITDATSSVYLVQAEDLGKYIRVGVIAINSLGGGEIQYSLSDTYNIPINSVLPLVSGDPEVGRALSISSGTWSNSPTSYFYQWQISDNGTTGWTYLIGETSPTYTVQLTDETKFIRGFVIAQNNLGVTLPLDSLPTTAVVIPTFPSDPVAFWKLADLTDSSSNGHTLTNNGSIDFGAGKIGNCALINGSNQGGKYLSSDVSGANTSTGFSLSLWIKGTVGDVNTSIMEACSASFEGWAIASNSSNALVLLVGNGGGWALVDNFGTYTVNTWKHIVLSADPATEVSPKIRIYLDGILAKTLDLVTWSAGPIDLGHFSFNYGYDDYSWAGEIDAVGVWDRPLSAFDVILLNNSGNGIEMP